MKVSKIVNWMGIDIPCCEEHSVKLRKLGLEFGLLLLSKSSKKYIHNPECEFCENLKKKEENE